MISIHQLVEARPVAAAPPVRGFDWKCAMAALSLGNLCCLAVWTNVFSGGAVEIALMKQPPGLRELLAIALAVGAIGLFGYWPVRQFWRGGSAPALVWRIALAPLFACALNGVRSVVGSTGWYAALRSFLIGLIGERHLTLFAALAALFLAGALLRPLVLRAMLHLALLLSPLLAVAFGYAGFVAARYDAFPPVQLATPLVAQGQPPRARVVWVVFDEWDYRLAFTARPSGLHLPHLDALAAESTLFTDAHPAGSDTIHSILGSLYGQPLLKVESDGRDLLLTLGEMKKVSGWDAPGSLFAEARRRGWNASATGWYLPYDRLFGSSLTRCHWGEFTPFRAIRGESVAGTALRYLGQVVEIGGPLAPWTRSAHQHNYHEVLGHGLGAIANPAVDLAFIHMVIPHAPVIYDGASNQFRAGVALNYSYFDNLKLMDATIGRMMDEFRRVAPAPATVLILSSDHRLRGRNSGSGAGNDRVPLLVRWPGELRRESISTAFCTTNLKDLILGVLDGRIGGAAGLRSWAGQREGRCAPWGM